jgi:hypothetical protein
MLAYQALLIVLISLQSLTVNVIHQAKVATAFHPPFLWKAPRKSLAG